MRAPTHLVLSALSLVAAGCGGAFESASATGAGGATAATGTTGAGGATVTPTGDAGAGGTAVVTGTGGGQGGVATSGSGGQGGVATSGSGGQGGAATTGGGGGGDLCGNTKTDGAEQCDDGNHQDGDGCEADCTLPVCGDQIVDPGQMCLTGGVMVFVGQKPSAVRLVDVDGDGRLDLVDLASDSALIEARPGLANGGFGPSVTQPTGTNPIAFAVGGFFGPGSRDLVVSERGPEAIAVYRNQSTAGAIAFGARTPVITFGKPAQVTVGNFDDSPYDDFAGAGLAGYVGFGTNLLGSFTQSPLYLGNGAASIVALDQAGTTQRLAVGLVEPSGSILVLPKSGSTFTAAGAKAYAVPTPVALAAADLDGDGVLDLAAATGAAGGFATLRGVADGTFGVATNHPNIGANCGALVLADLDGDHDVDVALACAGSGGGSGSVAVYANDGKGVFAQAKLFSNLAGPSGIDAGNVTRSDLPDLAVSLAESSQIIFFRADP
jgi:cysteine-rich repeat protein